MSKNKKYNENFVDPLTVNWLAPDSLLHLPKIVSTSAEVYAELPPIEMMRSIDRVIANIKAICESACESYGGKGHEVLHKDEWRNLWRKITIEFGQWSRLFNTALIRRMIESENQIGDIASQHLHQHLLFVYAYWWNRMHFIHVGIFLRNFDGKKEYSEQRLETRRDFLQKLIEGNINMSQLSKDFLDSLTQLRQGLNSGNG